MPCRTRCDLGLKLQIFQGYQPAFAPEVSVIQTGSLVLVYALPWSTYAENGLLVRMRWLSPLGFAG